jgi:ATP-dependent Zn protease
MEDLIKAKKVDKEKPSLQTQKDRIWQEELLGAFLPQVQEEIQVPVQIPETLKHVKVNEDENSKAKIIYLDENTFDTDLKSEKDTDTSININNDIVSIIQLSLLVTILTAFLLWFFEPSFVQSKFEFNDQDSLKNTDNLSIQKFKKDDILNHSETYYTSKSKLIFCSILAGVFAFTLLYSLPRNV